MLALHAGVDWDWEMPALFVWFFGAGGVVLASRRPRLGELGRTPRIVAALAVLVLAITPALFAVVAGRRSTARPTRWRCATAATAIDAALTATERFGMRPEPWLILGYCDARARPVRAGPARDGRRPRAGPGQLAARLRPGDRLRRVRRWTRSRTRRSSAAAQPARPVRAAALLAICGPQKTDGPPPRGPRAGADSAVRAN